MTRKVIILLIIIVAISSCRLLLSRKTSDAIKNPQALEYYIQAQEQSAKGKVGFQNAINLLNKADSLEPKNAIILHERGLTKFNSKIDIDGSFIDLQLSINYSTDEKDKLIRYNNRGICYMEINKMDKACEDWARSGKYGESYTEKYCNK
ncbi:hypothetical protein SAMN05216474_2490 [Lishizhenia tianjinensis]|uniref:Tetratricopeptide repeat-containing protein n=1 Tax=Lishizhenia tianjinensis TaxID=477690 RepID=A0A1I7B2H7_9FLAO|nr:hypothetical protein [Lishizhenia tianjinensis]SFT81403.1 hypothetical protein SAMN05216474_2490 [Lishizhenia tianjinensis]